MPLEAFGSECRRNADDTCCIISVWIWQLVPPFLVTMGTIGNIINVVILFRKNLRSKPCFMLVFLAVSDLIVIWSWFLLDGLIFGYGIRLPKVVCLFVHILKYGFGAISLWIAAIFTIERFLFVLLPHQSNKHLTQTKTVAILCCILVTVIPLNGLAFWQTVESSTPTIALRNINGTNKNFQNRIIGQELSQNMLDIIKGDADVEKHFKSSFTENSTAMIKKFVDKSSLAIPTPLIKDTTTSSSARNVDGSTPENFSYDEGFVGISRGNGKASNAVYYDPTSEGILNEAKDELRDTLSDKDDNAFNTANTSNDTILVCLLPRKSNISGNKQIICHQMLPCWSPSFDNASVKYLTQILIIFVGGFVPCAIIMTGNGVLIYALSRRKPPSTSDFQTIMLFIISALVMITITPEVAKSIVLLTTEEMELSSTPFALFNALAECITASNYTLNFFCYLWKSTIFKEEWKCMLKGLKSKLCQMRTYRIVLMTHETTDQ